jgi:hypothetical protein
MARYSLADMRFPESVDGYLMLADHATAALRSTPIRSRHGHDEVGLHLIARGETSLPAPLAVSRIRGREPRIDLTPVVVRFLC